MLTNIIDRRKRPYRFKKINAVIEPTCHDNSGKGGKAMDTDNVPRDYAGIGYDEKEHVALSAAVLWANTFPHAVTLYLYDQDGGIYVSKPAPKRKRKA